jgi:hypothetical protein
MTRRVTRVIIITFDGLSLIADSAEQQNTQLSRSTYIRSCYDSFKCLFLFFLSYRHAPSGFHSVANGKPENRVPLTGFHPIPEVNGPDCFELRQYFVLVA